MSTNKRLIPQFKINTLTKSQYEEALIDGLINQDELYCVAESTDLELCERVNALDEEIVITQNEVRLIEKKADNAMPKLGGVFEGDIAAFADNRDTSCLRNIEVRITSPTGALQSTNSIVMVRK